MADADTLRLVVSVGGERFEVNASKSMTWKDVAQQLSDVCGVAPEGLRLLFKGKTASPETVLSTEGVKSGTRLMALKTGKQHGDETRRANREAQARRAAAADDLRDSADRKSSDSGASSAPSVSSAKRDILGDPLDGSADAYLLMVTHAGKLYRVAFPTGESGIQAGRCRAADATLLDLKKRLEGMTSMSVSDQVILFAGRRNISDASKLIGDLGIKNGASLMLLAGRNHHKAVETRVDVDTLAKDLTSLAATVRSVSSRVRSRLLNGFSEVSMAVSQADSELKILRKNLDILVSKSDGKDGDRVAILQKELSAIEKTLTGLHEHAKSYLL